MGEKPSADDENDAARTRSGNLISLDDKSETGRRASPETPGSSPPGSPEAPAAFRGNPESISRAGDVKPGEDPHRYDELVKEVSAGTTAYELAAPFMAQMVIDPNDTRRFLIDMLEVLSRRMTNGVGQHRLADWPPAL